MYVLLLLSQLSVGGAHEAGQAPLVSSAPFVGALGVKLAAWATNGGTTNLSVSGMSLILPNSFLQSVSTFPFRIYISDAVKHPTALVPFTTTNLA